MKPIIENAAGPTGLFGIWQSRLPQSPEELLVFLQTGLAIVSILALVCQIVYWGYRFYKFLRGKK